MGISQVERLQSAIAAAERGESRLTPEMLQIEGMSSPRVRHLLVNLQAENYLEVGSWKGSTLIAASAGATTATGVDDFSQFNNGTVEGELRANLERFAHGKIAVIPKSIYSVRSDELPTEVDVCFYDGDHALVATYRAIAKLYPALAAEAILLVDDANLEGVIETTKQALSDCRADIVFEQTLPARFNGDVDQWWNGLWVAVIHKT